jgi:hypothetical protein
MHVKQAIKAKELIKDVRSGMTVPQLTDKYQLSQEALDRVLRYLVEAGLITCEQLGECRQLSDSQIIRAFVTSCSDVKFID